MIEFLRKSEKPFLLLLPVYTATKSYWRQFAEEPGTLHSTSLLPSGSNLSSNSGASSSSRNRPRNVMYLLPPDSYEYHHPEGTGKDIPPFFSAWFVGGFVQSSIDR